MKHADTEMPHSSRTHSSDDVHATSPKSSHVTHSEYIAKVDIAEIILNPFQPRKNCDQKEIEELAESIRAIGMIQPPVVRMIKGSSLYELVAGERRLHAAKKAGIQTLPVIIKNWDDVTSAEVALVENIQRVDLNPIEIAKALRNLIGEFDFSQEQLAVRIGKKRSTVSNYLRLLGLPKNIQASLLANDISMGHAKALLSIESHKRRDELHTQIVAQGLTVRQTEALAIKHSKKEKPTPKQNSDNIFLNNIEQQLQRSLNTRVSLLPKGNGGTISIEYFSNDDLDRILSFFSFFGRYPPQTSHAKGFETPWNLICVFLKKPVDVSCRLVVS